MKLFKTTFLLALAIGLSNAVFAQNSALYNSKMQLKADTNFTISEVEMAEWSDMEASFLYAMATQFKIPEIYLTNQLSFHGIFEFSYMGEGKFSDVKFHPSRYVLREQKIITKFIVPAFQDFLKEQYTANSKLFSGLTSKKVTFYLPYSYKLRKPSQIVDEKGFLVPTVLIKPFIASPKK